ncbi:hypothetical protein JPSP43_10570 [Staphylococcus pseudintermedius]
MKKDNLKHSIFTSNLSSFSDAVIISNGYKFTNRVGDGKTQCPSHFLKCKRKLEMHWNTILAIIK